MLVYPFLQGERINAIAYISFPALEGTDYSTALISEPSIEDLNKQYEGWEQEVQDILRV